MEPREVRFNSSKDGFFSDSILRATSFGKTSREGGMLRPSKDPWVGIGSDEPNLGTCSSLWRSNCGWARSMQRTSLIPGKPLFVGKGELPFQGFLGGANRISSIHSRCPFSVSLKRLNRWLLASKLDCLDGPSISPRARLPRRLVRRRGAWARGESSESGDVKPSAGLEAHVGGDAALGPLGACPT